MLALSRSLSLILSLLGMLTLREASAVLWEYSGSLWRGPCGEKLEPPANNHVNELESRPFSSQMFRRDTLIKVLWKTLKPRTRLVVAWSQTHRNWERTHVHWFTRLSFGAVCYTAVDNWHSSWPNDRGNDSTVVSIVTVANTYRKLLPSRHHF